MNTYIMIMVVSGGVLKNKRLKFGEICLDHQSIKSYVPGELVAKNYFDIPLVKELTDVRVLSSRRIFKSGLMPWFM